MNIKFILTLLLVSVLFISCEDITNPSDGLQEANLYVQFGAGTPDTVVTDEGSSSSYIVQAPISFNTDLTGMFSLSGDAELGADFDIISEFDVNVSQSSAEFTIPFKPTEGADLVPDQVELTFEFPTDETTDGGKALTVVLEGATGPDGISLDGGKGPIRKSIHFIINDVD